MLIPGSTGKDGRMDGLFTQTQRCMRDSCRYIMSNEPRSKHGLRGKEDMDARGQGCLCMAVAGQSVNVIR